MRYYFSSATAILSFDEAYDSVFATNFVHAIAGSSLFSAVFYPHLKKAKSVYPECQASNSQSVIYSLKRLQFRLIIAMRKVDYRDAQT